MTAAAIVFYIAIGIGFLIGFFSINRGNGVYLNTYEKLYITYKDSKIKLKELELEMMKEETNQIQLEIEKVDREYNSIDPV